MLESSPRRFALRRLIAASTLALSATATVAVAEVASAAPSTAPKCPSKSYFLQKFRQHKHSIRGVQKVQCSGTWAGVEGYDSYGNDQVTLFHHTGGTWKYEARTARNCKAAPRDLKWICEGD